MYLVNSGLLLSHLHQRFPTTYKLRCGIVVRAFAFNNPLFWTEERKKENDMEQKFCQSCGMPMATEIYGTNADGSLNEDYCMYCYKDGAFVGPADCTMEQMIDFCAQFTDEMNKHTGLNLTPEQAKEQMRQFFPHLKRWKK